MKFNSETYLTYTLMETIKGIAGDECDITKARASVLEIIEFVKGICNGEITEVYLGDIKKEDCDGKIKLSLYPESNSDITIEAIDVTIEKDKFLCYSPNVYVEVSLSGKPDFNTLEVSFDGVNASIIVYTDSQPNGGIYYVNNMGKVVDGVYYPSVVEYYDKETLEIIEEGHVLDKNPYETISTVSDNLREIGFLPDKIKCFDEAVSDDTIMRTFTEGTGEKFCSWVSEIFEDKYSPNSKKVGL